MDISESEKKRIEEWAKTQCSCGGEINDCFKIQNQIAGATAEHLLHLQEVKKKDEEIKKLREALRESVASLEEGVYQDVIDEINKLLSEGGRKE